MTTAQIHYRNIVINSSVLYVTASILQMTLHELGHFVAALLTGAGDVVLYHNAVKESIDGLGVNDLIFINAAGPNASLLIGLIFHYYCHLNPSRNLSFLFSLYMSVFGYIGFFGYVMIAPFFTYSDTGYICYLLDVPVWLTYIIAITGASVLFVIMKKMTRYFVELGTETLITHAGTRVRFINAVMLYPLLIGIVVTTLLNLPVPSFLSLIAPVCGPLAILWTYAYARSKKYEEAQYNQHIHTLDKFDFLWVLVLLLIVNLNRMLTGGFFL